MTHIEKAITMLKVGVTTEELSDRIVKMYKSFADMERNLTDNVAPHLGTIGVDEVLLKRAETDVNNMVKAVTDFSNSVNDLKSIVDSTSQKVDKTRELQ